MWALTINFLQLLTVNLFTSSCKLQIIWASIVIPVKYNKIEKYIFSLLPIFLTGIFFYPFFTGNFPFYPFSLQVIPVNHIQKLYCNILQKIKIHKAVNFTEHHLRKSCKILQKNKITENCIFYG